jgi:hypothetical protein
MTAEASGHTHLTAHVPLLKYVKAGQWGSASQTAWQLLTVVWERTANVLPLTCTGTEKSRMQWHSQELPWKSSTTGDRVHAILTTAIKKLEILGSNKRQEWAMLTRILNGFRLVVLPGSEACTHMRMAASTGPGRCTPVGSIISRQSRQPAGSQQSAAAITVSDCASPLHMAVNTMGETACHLTWEAAGCGAGMAAALRVRLLTRMP